MRTRAFSSVLLTICLLLGLTVPGNAQRGQRTPQDPRNLTIVPAGPPPTPSPQRTALVIGNATYSQTNTLRNPVNDATAMAAELKHLGFQVVLLKDAKRRAMLKAIAELGSTLTREGGVGLVYYAGHGLQVKGENYLVPVDTPWDSDTFMDDMVPVQRIIERMEDAKNGFNILILDACRDNPFISSTRGGTVGLAAMEAPLGTLVAFAASRNQSALDGSGTNGLYTSYLLQYLQVPGLSVEQIFKQVRNGVRAATQGKQVPEEWTKLQGEFFFVPSAPVPTPIVSSLTSSASPPATTDPEAAMWAKAETSSSSQDIKAFLDAYPNSRFTPVAQLKFQQLQKAEQDRKRREREAAEAQARAQKTQQPQLQKAKKREELGNQSKPETPASPQLQMENIGSVKDAALQLQMGNIGSVEDDTGSIKDAALQLQMGTKNP